MKTIVFALQVFGLIAILPLFVALEMNHGTTPISANEAKVAVAEETETFFPDFGSAVSMYPIAAVAIQQCTLKTKKKYNNTSCSCRDCKCGSICTCKDF